MELSKEKKNKISLARECTSYGCSNTFYISVGQATGIHYFKFPLTNHGSVCYEGEGSARPVLSLL